MLLLNEMSNIDKLVQISVSCLVAELDAIKRIASSIISHSVCQSQDALEAREALNRALTAAEDDDVLRIIHHDFRRIFDKVDDNVHNERRKRLKTAIVEIHTATRCLDEYSIADKEKVQKVLDEIRIVQYGIEEWANNERWFRSRPKDKALLVESINCKLICSKFLSEEVCSRLLLFAGCLGVMQVYEVFEYRKVRSGPLLAGAPGPRELDFRQCYRRNVVVNGRRPFPCMAIHSTCSVAFQYKGRGFFEPQSGPLAGWAKVPIDSSIQQTLNEAEDLLNPRSGDAKQRRTHGVSNKTLSLCTDEVNR